MSCAVAGAIRRCEPDRSGQRESVHHQHRRDRVPDPERARERVRERAVRSVHPPHHQFHSCAVRLHAASDAADPNAGTDRNPDADSDPIGERIAFAVAKPNA
jgi:hypothetical protein